MKLTNKDHVEKLLMQIERVQQHVKSVHAALYAVREVRRHANADDGNLLRHLHELEMDAWRNLAMWGLTLDDTERDRIKAAAYDRFLKDGMSVASYLTSDGTMPSSWSGADEKTFREMAREAFAPKDTQ